MKKSVIISVCAVLVLAALIVSLLFVFSGKGEEPEVEKPALEGTWVVAALYTNDVPMLIENQFMVFTDSKAAMYKDGAAEPYASSAYTLNEANQLILSDISREYRVDRKTDNCVRLYESTTTYMLLIRNGSSELVGSTVSAESLAGKWNILMKGDQFNNGEVMEFSGSKLLYYRAGAAEPSATTDYTLSATGVIAAESLGLAMKCYRVSDSIIVFVEQNGNVWELSK